VEVKFCILMKLNIIKIKKICMSKLASDSNQIPQIIMNQTLLMLGSLMQLNVNKQTNKQTKGETTPCNQSNMAKHF